MGKNKNPKIKNAPNRQKEPTASKQLTSNDGGQVYWSFSLIDCDGQWGFNRICKNQFHTLITNEFKDKEGTTWAQIKSNGSHHIEKNKLIKQAQKRLEDIKLDDLDELFSMRFSGRERVWGIREGNIFKLLWWDPKHEICPSVKK